MLRWLSTPLLLPLLLPLAGCFGDLPYDESRAAVAPAETSRARQASGGESVQTRTACLHPEILFRAIHPERGTGFARGDYEVVIELDGTRRRTFLCRLQPGKFTCSDLEDGLLDGESVSVRILPPANAEDSTAKLLVLYTAGSELPAGVRASIVLGQNVVFDVTVRQEELGLDTCTSHESRYVADALASFERSGAEAVEISL